MKQYFLRKLGLIRFAFEVKLIDDRRKLLSNKKKPKKSKILI